MPINPRSIRLAESYVGVDGIRLTVCERTGLTVPTCSNCGQPADAGERYGCRHGALWQDAEAAGFTATQDGRHADLTGWSDGSLDEAVFFERYENGARVSHGWLDPVSRKVAQSG